MNLDNPEPTPDPEDEIDDPYIHSVSTEEFVETVERASHVEADSLLTPEGEADEEII